MPELRDRARNRVCLVAAVPASGDGWTGGAEPESGAASESNCGGDRAAGVGVAAGAHALGTAQVEARAGARPPATRCLTIALKTALSISLRQSPFLSVIPDSAVARTLPLMTHPAHTKPTPEVSRELCQRIGSKAYIAGAIGSLGSEYVLGLRA